MKYRLFNWMYAHLTGHFWLPCPICKKGFGGHEEHGNVYYGGGSGESTCSDCIDKAEKLSLKDWEKEKQKRGIIT